MRSIGKIYSAVTKVEAVIVPVFVCIITALVFVSAVARTLGYPLNWAVDISLLLLAWTVGLGGDLAIRMDRVVNVDMIISHFSPRVRKFLALLWCAIIIVFLAFMVKNGIDLCLSNLKRVFQTLQIRYVWAHAAVPAGCLLMLISTAVRMVKIFLDLPLVNKKMTALPDDAGGLC